LLPTANSAPRNDDSICIYATTPVGLRIDPSYHQKPLNSLSGGFKLRVLLAQALFQEPDTLLLDEPTNHLDIEAIESLAQALNTYHGTLIFVSHDRHFISKIANRFLCISQDKKLIDFKGSLTEFEKLYEV